MIVRQVRPRTLADDARDAFVAKWERNPDRLVGFCWPEEVQALGWTETKVRRFFEEVIEPTRTGFARPKLVSTHVNVGINGAPTQGVATARLVMPSGRTIELIEFVDASDSGARTSIWSVLEAAWQLEFSARNPHAIESVESAVAAKLAGLRHDRKKLAQVGLHAAFKRSKMRAVPFDEWEAEMVRWLQERKVDIR